MTTRLALAREAFNESRWRRDSSQRIIHAARRWGEIMKLRLDEVVRIVPVRSWAVERAGLGGFGGLEPDGTPLLYLVNVGININPQQEATTVWKITKRPVDDPHPIGI